MAMTRMPRGSGWVPIGRLGAGVGLAVFALLVLAPPAGAEDPQRYNCPGGFDWIRVEVPHLDVSSTDLRARARDGRPLDYLVTDSVLDVIRARNLYAEIV